MYILCFKSSSGDVHSDYTYGWYFTTLQFCTEINRKCYGGYCSIRLHTFPTWHLGVGEGFTSNKDDKCDDIFLAPGKRARTTTWKADIQARWWWPRTSWRPLWSPTSWCLTSKGVPRSTWRLRRAGSASSFPVRCACSVCKSPCLHVCGSAPT